MNVHIQQNLHISFCYSNEEEKREVIKLLKKHVYYNYYLNKIELNKVNEKLYNIRRDWERRYYARDKTLKVAILEYFGNLNDFSNVNWKVRKSTNQRYNMAIYKAINPG